MAQRVKTVELQPRLARGQLAQMRPHFRDLGAVLAWAVLTAASIVFALVVMGYVIGRPERANRLGAGGVLRQLHEASVRFT